MNDLTTGIVTSPLDISPDAHGAEFAQRLADKLLHRIRGLHAVQNTRKAVCELGNALVLSVFKTVISLIEIYYEALRNTSS